MMILLWFFLTVIFPSLSDFHFLLSHRIAWCPSGGKELSSLLSTCVVLYYIYNIYIHAVLIVCVPSPFGFMGRIWNNSIVSVP